MSQSHAGMEGRHFRNALRSFATGVTIVTTTDAEDRDVGLTANSFNSVSMDPPMILWSLSKNAASLPAFQANDYFAVHILSVQQQALSDRFARRGADKFADLPLERGLHGVPLIGGCSARFQCRTAFRHEGGDHVIFVGEVESFDHFEREPLVFHGGKYAKVLPRMAPEPVPTDEVESSFRKDFLGYLLGLASAQLYRPVRRRCVELGISEPVYYVLTVLMARPHLTVPEIDALLAYSGNPLPSDLMSTMMRSGWVEVDEPGRSLNLTESGRRMAMEIYAVAKAAESSLSQTLDFEEAAFLKQLLKRVIRSTMEPAPGTVGASS